MTDIPIPSVDRIWIPSTTVDHGRCLPTASLRSSKSGIRVSTDARHPIDPTGQCPGPGAVPSQLDRRFEAVVFDWDGTAVPDRRADARRLREVVERLSALGLDLLVVTGTHVENVDSQLQARPRGPGRLLYCVNRGSEVYEASEGGVELVWRRTASAVEDDALDASAAATVDLFARRGLAARLVSQRLNRRKIDLIPEPEWADPPKARIGELLSAVEHGCEMRTSPGLPRRCNWRHGAQPRPVLVMRASQATESM